MGIESPTDPPTESPTDQPTESPTVSSTTAAPTYSPLTNDNIFLVVDAWFNDKQNDKQNMEDVYGPIEQWDVSDVTSMHKPDADNREKGLFEMMWTFNSNISTWNVGKVTDMARMFSNGGQFNVNISKWNVDNVEDMTKMFESSSFNHNIVSWKIGKVTAMNNMFVGSRFNQNLCGWLVNPNFPSKIDTVNMFAWGVCKVKSDPSPTNVCQYCNN